MPSWSGSGVGSDPAQFAVVVTPSDATRFTFGYCRALYVGVSGDITALVKAADGTESAVLFKAVPVGILPICCNRVNNTATTATNMVALY